MKFATEDSLPDAPARRIGFVRRAALCLAHTPFARLLKPLYHLSLALIVRTLRREPHVQAVYLLGSGASDAFTPGVSDIDLLVIIADGARREAIRQGVYADTVLLRGVVPMIAPETEIAVFSESEFAEMILPLRPDLLSIGARSKLLWRRGGWTPPEIPYELAHELVPLAAAWRKFVRAEPNPWASALYRDHVRQRAGAELQRIGGQLELPRGTVNTSSHFALFAEVLSVLTSRVESAAFVPPSEEGEQTIPNYLYRESLTLLELRGRDVPAYWKILRVGDDPAALPLAIRSAADFVQFRGALLPLSAAAGEFILLPSSHPATFAALRGDDVRFEELPKSIERANRFALERLSAQSHLLFDIPSTTLVFALREIAFWQVRLTAPREIPLAATESVARLLQSGLQTEAYFQAQCALCGGERRPARTAVLIATRNRCEMLKRALGTVMNQSRPADAVIVVDNGSTDGTAAMVRALSSVYPMLRLVHEPRPGVQHARNRAIAEAGPDIDVVAFLDDDEQAPADWLAELVLPFEFDAQIVSTGGGVDFDASDRTVWGDFYYYRKNG